MADDATPTGERTAADYRAVADAVRSRVDVFGKTLAGLATVGTAAISINEVNDLFPAAGDKWWTIGACLALAVAAGAAVAIAVRLMLAAGPVVMDSDLESNDRLGKEE